MSNRKNGPPHTGNRGHDKTWTKVGSNLAWVFIGVLFVRVLWETVRTGIMCSAADNLDRKQMTKSQHARPGNEPSHSSNAQGRENSEGNKKSSQRWFTVCLTFFFAGVLSFMVPKYLCGSFKCLTLADDKVWYLWYLLPLGLLISGVVLLRRAVISVRLLAEEVDRETAKGTAKELWPKPDWSKGGWHSAFVGAVFVMLAMLLHLSATLLFKASLIPDPYDRDVFFLLKVIVLVIGLVGAMQAAHVIVRYVLGSFIESPATNQADDEKLLKTLRRLGTAIAGILAALAALATIFDVFGSTH